jgi:hypothetical protein
MDDDEADITLAFDGLFDAEVLDESDVDEIAPERNEVGDVETVEPTVEEVAPELDGFDGDQASAVSEVTDAGVADSEVADAATVAQSEDFDFSVVWPESSDESVDGDPELALPPLELSHEPDQDTGEVPDDVAEAVRRAIAAIESASVAATPAAEVTSQLPQVDDFTIEFIDAAGSHEVAPVTGTAASAFGTFAPPAMATRAEVLYGQMTDDGQVIEEPVVAPADGDNDRSSALRRLIGSLRRREH